MMPRFFLWVAFAVCVNVSFCATPATDIPPVSTNDSVYSINSKLLVPVPAYLNIVDDSGDVKLVWDEASIDASYGRFGYTIVRFPYDSDFSTPEPGLRYFEGEAFGDGVVIYSGRGFEVVDSYGLCGRFIYKLFLHNPIYEWQDGPESSPHEAAARLPREPDLKDPDSLSWCLSEEGPSSIHIKEQAGEVGLSYNWFLPPGSSIIGPHNGSSIKVKWGKTHGALHVSAVNSCGASPVASYPVIISVVPDTPSFSPSFPESLCVKSLGNISLSVSPVKSALSYSWSLPPSSRIVRGDGNSSIVGDFTRAVSTGTRVIPVAVAAKNACGEGGKRRRDLVVVSDVPSAISSIQVPREVCLNGRFFAKASPALRGDTYEWSFPSGDAISLLSGQGLPVVSLSGRYASSFLPRSGVEHEYKSVLSVGARNSCGSGPLKSAEVDLLAYLTSPASIQGPESLCIGGEAFYGFRLRDYVKGTTYSWSFELVYDKEATQVFEDPRLVRLTPADTSATFAGIHLSFNDTPEGDSVTKKWLRISVKSQNVCGSSADPQTGVPLVSDKVVPITIPSKSEIPPKVTMISGPKEVCLGERGVTFSVPPNPAGNLYNWVVNHARASISGSAQNAAVNFRGVEAGEQVTIFAWYGTRTCPYGPSASHRVDVILCKEDQKV